MNFIPLVTDDLRIAICQVLSSLPGEIVRYEIWPEVMDVQPIAPGAPPRRLRRVTQNLQAKGQKLML